LVTVRSGYSAKSWPSGPTASGRFTAPVDSRSYLNVQTRVPLTEKVAVVSRRFSSYASVPFWLVPSVNL